MTPAGEIEILRAEPADLDTVVSILEEAAQWIMAQGIDQWPATFPPQWRTRIVESIQRGEVHLARLDGQPVGTLTLQWSDRMVWGDIEDDAGYVHRLAIRRAFGGKGLGRQLLGWAEAMVAVAGKEHLRLDCMAENPALMRYYERAGFVYRGRVEGQGWNASLYEKRVRADPVRAEQ